MTDLSDFLPAVAATLCSRVAAGESLASICSDDGMPSLTQVFLWLAAKDEFRVQYDRSRVLCNSSIEQGLAAVSSFALQSTEDDGLRPDENLPAPPRPDVSAMWLRARMPIPNPEGENTEPLITEIRLVAVPIPERDADGYPIKKQSIDSDKLPS